MYQEVIVSGFSLHCTTCQTRLRVRDARAIGKILPCPRCGSMVLIDGPMLATAKDALPAASCETADRLPQPAASETGVTDHCSGDPDFHQASSLDTAFETAPVNEPAAGTVGLPIDGVALQTSLIRRWLVALCGAIAGVGLAVGLVAIVIAARRGDNLPGPVAVLTNSDPVTVAGSTAAPEPPPPPLPSPPPPLPLLHETETEAGNVDSGEQGSITETVVMKPDVNLAKGAGTAETADPAGLIPPEFGPSTTHDEPAPAAAEPPGAYAGLANLLDSASVVLRQPTANDPQAADRGEGRGDGPENASSPGDPVHGVSASADLDHVPPVPTSQRRTIDVTARLSDRIQAVNFARVPLNSFVRSMSRMSTIPIVFDHDSLIFVSYEAPISLKATTLTVDELLRQALSTVQLTPQVFDNHVLVTSPAFVDGGVKQVAYTVSDLASNSEQLAELKSWVEMFVAPEIWRAGQGSSIAVSAAAHQLKVTSDRRVHLRVLAFLERLRLARGLPFVSKLGPRLANPAPAWQQLQDRLQHATSINAWHPTAFIAAIGEIEDHNRLTVLVDWQSVAEVPLYPDTPVTSAARGKPLGDIFDGLLQPLGLTYVAIDGHTIQITTPETAKAIYRVEFYSLGQRGADAAGRLQGLLASEANAHFVVDPASQNAIVWAADSVHRQMARLP